MNKTVVSAKTLDEAITKGCAELGVDMTEVDFNILDEGGMFKKMQVEITVKGSEPAPVKPAIVPADQSPVADADAQPTKPTQTAQPDVEEFEIVGQAKPAKAAREPRPVTEFDPNCPKFAKTLAFAQEFFRLMGDNLTVTTAHDDQEFTILVDGEDVSRLIGKNGKTMAAINTIVAAIGVNTHCGEPRRVVVDIAHYREKRRESLIALAKRKAEYVKTSGKSVKLEPMPARERVIVHLALQDVEGIITQSEGVEPQRFLVIKPGAR